MNSILNNMNACKTEYILRVNRVVDYINYNISENFTLEKLAGIANFSPFHFHRIFKTVTGESLYSFIRRVRLERAANMLVFKNDSITGIAFNCGFSSSSVFAYAFREHFGCSAGDYRGKNSIYANSKNSKNISKDSKDKSSKMSYNNRKLSGKQNNPEKHIKLNVIVKNFEDMKVCYIRHIGDYFKIRKTWDKLCVWAGARNLLIENAKYIGLYYDNPEITDENKLRYDACITIPERINDFGNKPEIIEDLKPSGEVGISVIKGGKYAVAHCEGKSDSIMKTYQLLFSEWFPSSGYQPDNKHYFEIYLNNTDEHPEKFFIMDICIPVKLL
ncbi:MAG TPA: GyrI-like domain-containing protein [bacterium]|nr:GyrI-like domain-containing protein [bacterium]